MTGFDLRTADLRAIDSMTQYPSIPTYHSLDPSNGGLLDEVTVFEGTVIGTEKVDGTNARIILFPDGMYLIGSRTELLHAKGDLIANPALGIVDAVRPIAEAACVHPSEMFVSVLFGEVYGHKIGGAAKRYASAGEVGFRLFDIMQVPVPRFVEMAAWPVERAARWRDNGGQLFVAEPGLHATARGLSLELTPRLFQVDGCDLPADLEKTRAFLAEHAPATRVALGDTAPGQAEGIVLRTPDRSVIAKARFQDYDRTLKRRGGRR